MRGRFPAPSGLSYSFGPGGISPAVKALILANIALFVLGWFSGEVETWLGMKPAAVVGQGQLEEVLLARPEERRKYIEEAAGILGVAPGRCGAREPDPGREPKVRGLHRLRPMPTQHPNKAVLIESC